MSGGIPNPLGAGTLGMARLGDEQMTLSRGHTSVLGVSYTISVSLHASALSVNYTVQKNNVAPLLVYYLISPLSVFSINGDATIIAPDQITYTPRPVTARTLLAGPILQGYKTMTWQWTTLQLPEWQHLISFYNPQSPGVTLTYPDETGTWVNRQVELLPPNFGQQQTVVLEGASMTFTGLLT